MNNPVSQNFSKRRNTRMLAVCVLYNLDINKFINEEMTLEDKNLKLEETLSDVLTMSQTEFFVDEFPTLFNMEYLRSLINKSYLDINSIDEIISNSLVKYTIDRLSYVDRAIIRVSTAEMLMNETPKNIIIDEALEITKELTNVDSDNQVRFNNRLLENIAGRVYGN